MKRLSFYLACWLGLELFGCRAAPAPPHSIEPEPPARSQPALSKKTLPEAPEPASAVHPPSLHLSWLPADTMAVAQLRPSPSFGPQLAQALETPPASRLRSLPLTIKFSLQQLSLPELWPRPHERLAALVWDTKQRAFWLWNQDDLSFRARRTLQEELGASTRFEDPYWIFESPDSQLEYFVHHRAAWLLACPKAMGSELREWLAKISPNNVGRLSWAPDAQEDAALLLRWRAPQLLESAPAPRVPALPVIGELRTTPRGGVQVNGASRGQP